MVLGPRATAAAASSAEAASTASAASSAAPSPAKGVPRPAAEPTQPAVRRKNKRGCFQQFKRCLSRIVSIVKVPDCIWDAYVERRCGRFPLDAPRLVDFVVGVQSKGAQNDGTASSPSASPLEVRRIPLEELPPKALGTVRFVVVSDTHERHREVVVPPGDVLLHCGDILMSSSLTWQGRGLRVLADFNDWLSTVPCRERVVVGGNHDWALEQLPMAQQKTMLSAAMLLHDECVSLPMSGVKVYGNAHSTGHSNNRAWQTPEAKVSSCCADAEVVVTHHSTWSLQEAVLAQAKPLLWASGHAHEAHGAVRRGSTLFVNASISNVKYNPVQAPFVVDIRTSFPAEAVACRS